MPRALAIAVAAAVTICDSLYIALAENLDVPLATADERLLWRLPSDPAVGERIVWVGDLSARRIRQRYSVLPPVFCNTRLRDRSLQPDRHRHLPAYPRELLRRDPGRRGADPRS